MVTLKKIFLFALIVCATVSLNAQYHSNSKKAVKFFEKGLKFYENKATGMAADNLQKAVGVDKNFVEAWMLLAQINKERGNFDAAISNFETALQIDPSYFPEGYMILAKVEYGIGRYEEALTSVERFEGIGKSGKVTAAEVGKLKELCRFAVNAVKNPVPFSPENLGDSVNSEKNEYWPSLSIDESTLVFTVLDPKNPDLPVEFGNRQEDFYYAVKHVGDGWSKRRNMGAPLNTDNNEGAQSLSADGRLLYFTGCNRPDGEGMCDIYLSGNYNGHWSVPVNLRQPVNTTYSEKQPSISADGQTLFFASDRPGGRGGLDIWFSRRSTDGHWLVPENAGDSINTPGNEQSPFIHPDGRTLYFSSEGHNNLGRGDIFISRMRDDGKWGSAENLGYPINTFNDEVGMIVNSLGDKAYFSSDRLKGRGMDIYEFDLYPSVRPSSVSYMKGRVFDAETYKGLVAKFQLIDLSTGKVAIEEQSGAGEGSFLVPLPTHHNFALNVSRPGYIFYSENFSFNGLYEKTKPYLKDVPLKPIKSGEKIILKNIFFEFDSDSLLGESVAELGKVVDFLNNNPGIEVEISGHTDSVGIVKYNQLLSERRASAVVEFLAAHGIRKDRLTFRGYGDSEPVASNETEEGRAKNRRTELKITQQ